MLCTANSINAVCTNWTVSVPACIPCDTECEPKKKSYFPTTKKCSPEQEQGNNPMTETQETRNYLIRRARDINYNKSDAIAVLFDIHRQTSPKNYKELIEWVKKGHYKLDAKRVKQLEAQVEGDDEMDFYSCGCFDGIIWTGRGEVDHKAHDAAQVERIKKHNDLLDTINVLPSEDGLKALKAFEEWMPKGPKN